MSENSKNKKKHNIQFSIKFMDTKVDPAEDFFRYSCGKWIENNSIPKDKTIYSASNELTDQNMECLNDICKQKKIKTELKELGLVTTLYNSAMNEAIIEKVKFKPLLDLLESIDKITSKDQISNIISVLHKNGIFVFFTPFSSEDQNDSTKYIFYIYQSGLSLPNKEYYLSTDQKMLDIKKEFKKHIIEIFNLVGETEKHSKENAEYVLNVETNIAQYSRSAMELRDIEKNYNKMHVDQFKKYNNLNLPKYLEELGVTQRNNIIIGQPEFIEAIDSILNTDILKIKTYMKWHILKSYAPYLHKDIENRNFDFFKHILLGQESKEPRWKKSINIINMCISDALGKLYVEKYFTKESEQKMAEMVTDIISSFKERLQVIDWMSDQTRQKAIQKLDKLVIKIGHPSIYRDYSEIIIKEDDLIGNIRRSIQFEIKRQMVRTGTTVDKDEWQMPPHIVNAYYSPTKIEIVFPAGIIQPPYFDKKMDPAVNYGAIGSIISHEITHGFDDQGRNYDSNGNINNWWTLEDLDHFNKKTQRIEHLYSQQEILPGKFINGKLTLGENIADLGGVNIAFNALQKKLIRTPKLRKNIDGLTPEQRFFISWGQAWRVLIRPEEAQRRLLTDQHSPNRYRCIIPVLTHSNFNNIFKTKQKKITENISIW